VLVWWCRAEIAPRMLCQVFLEITFRHSFAIHLVRSEVDIRRVQLLLGHSTIRMTAYVQFRDQDLQDVYNKVEF